MSHSAADESNKKLQQMEDAFEKLRSVTCVEKVDEMHEKFSMQKTNKLQLELEVRNVVVTAHCLCFGVSLYGFITLKSNEIIAL